jgi:hypothetical protein
MAIGIAGPFRAVRLSVIGYLLTACPSIVELLGLWGVPRAVVAVFWLTPDDRLKPGESL